MSTGYRLGLDPKTKRYFIEASDGFHQQFNSLLQAFMWLYNHMGPDDWLHWVDPERSY